MGRSANGELFPGAAVPALMKPRRSRWDCLGCTWRDLDTDGVPDGCTAPADQECDDHDFRYPWRRYK